ncbi:MAG: 2-phosphosulfolactate phosphatase [Ignavibacteriaceae bacterium]|nr:2-phosphosulfolactate phosphatase [Ignavibacteriaceae bacterium]
MKINVLITPNSVDELYFTGKTTVVIDVLRASTTIVEALQNGAKEIVPVATVEFAVKLSGGMFGGHTLLGGERNTRKIEGFALGNSPLEYNENIVSGKSIVFYTTNGSKAIVKAKFSENMFICCFNNINAIAKHLVKLNNDVEILCAGKSNLFSMEDTVCAGRLISEILKLSDEIKITDSSRAAIALNRAFGKNLMAMFQESEHGQLLLDNGFEEDLKLAAKVSSSEVIPYYTSSVIKSLTG